MMDTECMPFDRPPLDYPAGRDIGVERALPDSAHAVYNYLAARLTFRDTKVIIVWAAAHTLGMQRVTVRSALRVLVERGYIVSEHSADSRARRYRLVWDRATEQHPEQQQPAA